MMGLTNFLWCILLVKATIAQELPQNGSQPPNPISNDNNPSNSVNFNAGFGPKTPNVESQINAPPLSFQNNGAGSNAQNYPNFPFFGQGFGQSGQFQHQFGTQPSTNGQQSFKFGPPGLQQTQNYQFGPPNQQQNQGNQIPTGSASFQMNPASNGQFSSEYFKFGPPNQQMPSSSSRLSSQYGPSGLSTSFGTGSQQMSGSQMGTPYGASSQQMGAPFGTSAQQNGSPQMGASFGASGQEIGSVSGQQPFQVTTTEGQTNQKSGEGFGVPNYQMSGAGNFIPPNQMMQRAGEQTPSNNNPMSNGGENMSPNKMMENLGGAMSQNEMTNGGGFMTPSPPNFQMPGSGGFGPQIPPNNFMSNPGGFPASNPQMPGPGGFMHSFASVASAIIPSLMYMTTPGILFPSPPMFMQNPVNFYGQGPKPPQFTFGQPGGMSGGNGFNAFNPMQGAPGSGFNFQRPFNAMPSGNGFNFQRPFNAIPSGSGFNFQRPFNGQTGSNFPGFPQPPMFPQGGQMSQMFKPYQQQGTGPNNGGLNGVSGGNGPNSGYYMLQNNGNNGPKKDDNPTDVKPLQTGNNNKPEGMAPSINLTPSGSALEGVQPVPDVNSSKDNQKIPSTAATVDPDQIGAPSSGSLQIDAPPKDETNQGMSGGVETSEGGNNGDKSVGTERDGIPDDLTVTNEASSKQGPSTGHGSMSVGGSLMSQGNIGGGANIAAVPSSHQIQEGTGSGRLQGFKIQNGGSLNQPGLTSIGGDTDPSLVGEGRLAAGGQLPAGGGQLTVGGGQLTTGGGFGQSGNGGGEYSTSNGGSLGGSMGGQTGGSSGGQQIKLVTLPARKIQTINLHTVGFPAMKQGGEISQTLGSPTMKQGGTSSIKLLTLPPQGKYMQQGSSDMIQNGGGSTSGSTSIKMYPANSNRLSKYQMYPNSFLVTPIKTKLPRPGTSHGIINENFSMEDIINPLEHTMANQKQSTNASRT